VFSWLRMKKPGPGVGMVFTGFQVFMSITSMAPSLRLGLASTVVPFQAKVMPEPRCGMPAIGSSAILRRTSRLTTWPWGRRRHRTWAGWRPARGGSLVEEEVVQRLVQRRAAHALEARLGDGLAHLVVVHQAVIDGLGLGVVGNLPDLGMSLSATTKLLRGAASYTADTREACLPSSVVAS
jgi:hypothetical protein